MTAFTATLVDGDTELPLRGMGWGVAPLFLKELDLGFPSVRESTSENPGRDGVSDDTTLFGARTVSATVLVRDYDGIPVNGWLDRLRAMCSPAKRVRLVVTRDGWETARQVWLRANTLTCLVTKTSHVFAEVSLAWSAPAGVLEATVPSQTTVSPVFESTGLLLTPGDAGDEALSLTPGDPGDDALELIPGTGSNIQTVSNPGTLPAEPRCVIQGRCVNPQIILRDTNTRISLGMTIPANTTVEIDVARRSITLGGVSVYERVDWSVSRWFTLPAGESHIEFDTDDRSNDCLLVVNYTPRYL